MRKQNGMNSSLDNVAKKVCTMTNTQIKTNNPPKKKAANIQVDKLRTFEGHPFMALDDEDMNNLTESIRQQSNFY